METLGDAFVAFACEYRARESSGRVVRNVWPVVRVVFALRAVLPTLNVAARYLNRRLPAEKDIPWLCIFTGRWFLLGPFLRVQRRPLLGPTATRGTFSREIFLCSFYAEQKHPSIVHFQGDWRITGRKTSPSMFSLVRHVVP